MTFFWPDGLPVAVEADSRWVPRRLTWQARVHGVEMIVDRWRVDEEWWYARVWREYFTVITDTGLLIDVFHDLKTDTWYLQRLYD